MNYYFEDQVRASERVLLSAIAAKVAAEKQLRKEQVEYSGNQALPASAETEIATAAAHLANRAQEVLIAEKNHQKLVQGKKRR